MNSMSITPFHAMFSKLPDLSHLKTFGSACHVLMLKGALRGGKFMPVSSKGVFVGMTVLANCRILVDRQVRVYRPSHMHFSVNKMLFPQYMSMLMLLDWT